MNSAIEKSTYKSEFEIMTFPSKLNKIYKELSRRSERRAELEDLLNHLKIPYHYNDINEFENEFIKTGFVRVIAKSKDGVEIFLTQKGLDYLNTPQVAQIQQPNVVIENYQNSIVNKGESINQSGVFGNKGPENKSAQISNPNSPSKSVQRWQLIVAIIAVLTAISLALLRKFGIL